MVINKSRRIVYDYKIGTEVEYSSGKYGTVVKYSEDGMNNPVYDVVDSTSNSTVIVNQSQIIKGFR